MLNHSHQQSLAAWSMGNWIQSFLHNTTTLQFIFTVHTAQCFSLVYHPWDLLPAKYCSIAGETQEALAKCSPLTWLAVFVLRNCSFWRWPLFLELCVCVVCWSGSKQTACGGRRFHTVAVNVFELFSLCGLDKATQTHTVWHTRTVHTFLHITF